MTTDNKLLWKSTVVVALIASVTYLYFCTYCTGSWALGDFPVTLWCVWLGILLSTKIRVPVWLRAIIVCSCVGLYFFLPRFNIPVTGVTYMLNGLGAYKYLILFLFGLGISPELKQNNKFLENLVLFIVFLCSYIFMTLVEQRSWYTLYTFDAEPVEILMDVAKYGKSIPLAAAILFFIRLALSDRVQALLSRKAVPVAALLIILASGIYDIVGFVSSYGHIHISVILTTPAVSMAIILGIEKLVKSKKQSI